MEPRYAPIVTQGAPLPVEGPPDPVHRHQELTGHNGAFQQTDNGYLCCVCEAIADGEDMFRVPASGRPPSGYFEGWARYGYEWQSEASDASR